jgi:pyruvate/2-oxoglutarate/acetoin dehydrogenase E1 component
MGVKSFAEAARDALADEMRRDPTVWVLGEDVRHGGVFGQYKGLVEEFGPDRVVDTPISESTIMGAGLGAALVGTRPVIEMRIADFAMPAMDELVNQIAKVRYMFGGQARARVLVRMPHGLLAGSAAQHSQVVESWFVNLPGVVVAVPSTAADLAGLLRSGIRSDDPVLLFEPKAFFGRREEVASDEPVPFGRARTARAGGDVTVVTWGQAIDAALAGAEAAARQGIRAEVLDLRSLWPWDEDAVAASVSRTGRLVVVQEGVVAAGFGAEILARMAERLGPSGLRALRRVGAPRIPVPFAPELEAAVRVSADQVAAALLAAAAAA